MVGGGTVGETGRVACQTGVPLFLSLCQALLPGRCAVSWHFLLVLLSESLPPPTGHKYGVFIRLRALITLMHTYIGRVV